MKASRIAALLVLLPLSLAAYACGGTTGTTGAGGDGGGGGSDGSAADGSSPSDGGGTDLFPADTQKVVVTSKGGFGPGAMDGSTCIPSDTTYTITFPARELTWKVCASQDGGTFAFDTGTRTLMPADTGPLETALHAVRVQTMQQCGADAPVETLTMSSPAGDKVYYDDFYYCQEDGKTYVHGIGDVLTELYKLAK